MIGSYQGNVTVSIPVGTQYIGQTITIYHCANGTLEKVTATVDSNGNAVGTYSSLSPFAVTQARAALPITGLPDSYTLYTGGRVSWTPVPTGGTWDYDSDYLSMTKDGDKYTFKVLKEGKTTATYSVNGESYTVSITINKSTLPQTGDTTNLLPYIILALVSLCGIIAILYRKKVISR